MIRPHEPGKSRNICMLAADLEWFYIAVCLSSYRYWMSVCYISSIRHDLPTLLGMMPEQQSRRNIMEGKVMSIDFRKEILDCVIGRNPRQHTTSMPYSDFSLWPCQNLFFKVYSSCQPFDLAVQSLCRQSFADMVQESSGQEDVPLPALRQTSWVCRYGKPLENGGGSYRHFFDASLLQNGNYSGW